MLKKLAMLLSVQRKISAKLQLCVALRSRSSTLLCESCTLKDGKSFFNAALSALLLLCHPVADPSSPFSSSFKAKTKPKYDVRTMERRPTIFVFASSQGRFFSVEKIKNAIFNFLLVPSKKNGNTLVECKTLKLLSLTTTMPFKFLLEKAWKKSWWKNPWYERMNQAREPSCLWGTLKLEFCTRFLSTSLYMIPTFDAFPTSEKKMFLLSNVA